MLGTIFTHEMKPMEVEILVAEVGLEPAGDQMFHILYPLTVVDERDYAAIGGDAEAINTWLSETWTDGFDRAAAIVLGRTALGGPTVRSPTTTSKSPISPEPTVAGASTG